MLTFLAALAGALVAPEMAPDTGSYPVDAIRTQKSAAALVEFLVDPEGHQVSCQTLTELGDEDLSKKICTLQRDATFKPAKNEEDQPSYGVLRAFIKYFMVGNGEGKEIVPIVVPGITHEVLGYRVRRGDPFPDIDEFRQASGPPEFLLYPDIDFEVQSLPETLGKVLHIRVTVSLDKSGTVTHCVSDMPDSADGDLSRFADVACQQLQGVNVVDPLVVDGEPVPYVRSMQVKFAAASPE